MGNKVIVPQRSDQIIKKGGFASLRLSKFFEAISSELWQTQYIAGTTVDFDITGPAGFTLVRGTGTPYESSKDIWHIKGSVDYTHDSLTSVDLTISSLVFKTGPTQWVGGRGSTGTTDAVVLSGSSVINVTHSIATTTTQLYFDLEIDSKPTWKQAA